MKTHFKLKHNETYEIVESTSSAGDSKCRECAFFSDYSCLSGRKAYCRVGAGEYMHRPIIRIVKVTK